MNDTRLYIASSWKNEKYVIRLAEILRQCGIQVYCFAEMGDGQHHFKWPDVTHKKDDGITCLKKPDSIKAYDCDKYFLDWSNTCLLVNPCGRDAHIEAGYSKGKGNRLFILGEFPPGEFSNMYHIADGLFRLEEIQSLILEINR